MRRVRLVWSWEERRRESGTPEALCSLAPRLEYEDTNLTRRAAGSWWVARSSATELFQVLLLCRYDDRRPSETPSSPIAREKRSEDNERLESRTRRWRRDPALLYL